MGKNPTNVFYQWCNTTTFHGWSDWFNAHGYAKIVWSLLIGICVFGLALSLWSIIDDFAESDKWTTTVYETSGDDHGLAFPSITLCNINRLRLSMAEKYNFTSELRNFFFDQFGVIYPIKENEMLVPANSTAFKEWREKYNFTTMGVLDVMAHDLCTMIAQIRVQKYDQFEDVCSEETRQKMALIGMSITDVLSHEYGKCGQINFDPALFKSKETGSLDGITIILDAQLEDYLPDIAQNFLEEGITLQIGYDGRFAPGSWTMIPTRMHTFIGIEKGVTTIKEPWPQLFPPPCNNGEMATKVLPASHYTKTKCQFECWLANLLDTCSCVYFMRSSFYPTCEFDEYQACYSEWAANQTNWDALNMCYAHCKPACKTSSVKLTLSAAKFPSNKQFQELKVLILHNHGEPVTDESINSYLAIDIYFSSMQVQVIERYELYTLSILMSQIGGFLGLWAGISILTIFHAISYCIQGVGKSLFCYKTKINDKTTPKDIYT